MAQNINFTDCTKSRSVFIYLPLLAEAYSLSGVAESYFNVRLVQNPLKYQAGRDVFCRLQMGKGTVVKF